MNYHIENFNKRIALIVQGPILSKGKTPASRNKPMNEITDEDVVSFDCQDLICETVQKGKELFGAAVYVAWTTDDTSKIEKRIGEDSVLRIEDRTPQLPPNSGVIASNNKFRQFTAVAAGLRHLRQAKCNFAIKVRGDQTVPLKKLAEWLNHLESKDLLNNRIVVPCFKLGMAFGIEDFYLGGRYEMLEEACESYLADNFAEFSRNVHRDLFGKLSRHFLGANLKLPLYEYFIGESWDPVTKGQVQICRAAWDNLFITFPASVWEETSWRGIPLGIEKLNLYSDSDPEGIRKVLDSLEGCEISLCKSKTPQNITPAVDVERLSRFVFGDDNLLARLLLLDRKPLRNRIRRRIGSLLKRLICIVGLLRLVQ